MKKMPLISIPFAVQNILTHSDKKHKFITTVFEKSQIKKAPNNRDKRAHGASFLFSGLRLYPMATSPTRRVQGGYRALLRRYARKHSVVATSRSCSPQLSRPY